MGTEERTRKDPMIKRVSKAKDEKQSKHKGIWKGIKYTNRKYRQQIIKCKRKEICKTN